MTHGGLKAGSVILLMVIAVSLFHGFFAEGHLCLHHRPAGRSLSRAAETHQEACLCFTHGFFVPAVVPPQASDSTFEVPLPAWAPTPRPAAAGDIDHPPHA